MRLLDLFCGAGGASMGYHQAGFEVVGIDINPQKNYPFEFIQADITKDQLFVKDFDVIHASPPCQAYSVAKSLTNKKHPELVGYIRDLLNLSGKPYIIENVPGSPLNNPLILCGSMFPELRVYRHRLFEINPNIGIKSPAKCNHTYSMPKSKGEYHTLDKQEFITCVGHNFQAKSGRIAMNIEWMTRDELAQAIPPAYTKYIGEQLIKYLHIHKK